MVDEKSKRKANVTPSANATPLAKRNQQEGLARGIDDVFSEFRRSFDDLLEPFMPLTRDVEQALASLPARSSVLDLVDNGDHYTVTAELPGFNKDQVDVQVNKDGIAIHAEMKEEKEDKRKNYLHRERAYSSFQRFIAFPEEVVPGRVEGNMKDGVLELKIHKKEPKPEEKPQKVAIK
jgi:HSP20 family protein